MVEPAGADGQPLAPETRDLPSKEDMSRFDLCSRNALCNLRLAVHEDVIDGTYIRHIL